MITDDDALELHESHRGKIGILVKTPISDRKSLSLAYTPGVAAVSRAIVQDKANVWKYTNRGNLVAIVTDGTAVLGLGDIGPEAALPVMEGKAVLMKEFADVDAVPICLNTKEPDEIVKVVAAIAPSFGVINLEDISAPRCFEVENKLKQILDIPVFHDDQHGTAIVVLAALTNALKVVNKSMLSVRIVICGAGAAGIAIAKLLLKRGAQNLVLVNRKGIINKTRRDMNWAQQEIAQVTNPENLSGGLTEALKDSDVFIGVSAPNIATKEMIKSMKSDAIVFAMANPVPEIMPEMAKKGGAVIIATGRSDYPNQVNNVLAFPGVMRGLLDSHAIQVTEEMKLAAADALANYVTEPDTGHIIPDVLDKKVSPIVAEAVKKYFSIFKIVNR